MPRIEIYSSMLCGFCYAAKHLLKKKGVVWEEHGVDMKPDKRREMMARGGGRTVPQVFIDGTPIGGCDELHALDRDGRLDVLLGLAANASGGADEPGDG